MPDLVRGGYCQRVEDVMALAPGGQQPARSLPDLGRIVVPELVRNHLVERDVEIRAHRLSADHDLLFAALDRPSQVWVLGKNQEVALVGISWVEKREVEVFESATPRRAGEAATLGLASRPEPVHVVIFASETAESS